ncbi:small multidrug resistance pump [Rhodopseudomonas thermotolerans]|uniref:Small multidrug resistance pump n=2 Tax=Rhodopseudomonas TaxID=1073 RepID=A0A336JP49_9BRAD|nr:MULTISPECIES: multidrug efflux SMR transporter [Rhodopseudomonas]RED37696.1 small multidrug resistance pump [Rhodopseudomonas pentothenatexigens]REG04430.1 small multidrug resistance pump [Rhodopseudomonas thermotolerans]SSW90196.1 small multidrug resistance pump [Rhodopseudomonas pentothenatexigens]
MKWLYLLIAIVAEVVGTSALKVSQGFTVLLPSALVVVGYGAAFYSLSLTLSSIPVGIAYALWSGIGIVLISAVGWLWFGEALDVAAMIGISFIIIGVGIINFFSNVSAH